MPKINPDILKWARESAGLSFEAAADSIDLNDARGKTGAQRLEELEKGEQDVSRPLLLRMSKKYRRPLLVFYMKKPPEKGNRGEDFRTLPNSIDPSASFEVDALIRDIKGRQELIKDLLEDEEAEQLNFVGNYDIKSGTKLVREAVIELLNFDLEEFRRHSSSTKAFSYLRELMEDVGVFVMLIGNLGSHHTNIPVSIFRGFAIADNIAPVVVINDQDAKTAWTFTALHEFVHLMLGLSGISTTYSETRIEKFCNQIAGEVLLPNEELRVLESMRNSFEDIAPIVSEFANQRNLSRTMVAYRLLETGVIDAYQWKELADKFRGEWLHNKKVQKDDSSGGPSYYIVKRHKLGKPIVDLISRSIGDGSITHTRASRILGVAPRNVEPLIASTPTPKGGA